MALREILAQLGVKVDTTELTKADGLINAAAKNLKLLAAGFIAFNTSKALVNFTIDIADQADQLNKTAVALGIGTRALAEWRFAAEQTGVSAGVADKAITTFTGRVAKAAEGSKGSAELFNRLGLEIRDVEGNVRPTADLFNEAIQLFSELDAGAEKTGLGMDLFGKKALGVFNVFDQGEQGLEEVRAEFDQLFGRDFDRHIQQSTSLSANMGKLDATFDSFKQLLARALVPALDLVVRGMIAAGRWLSEIASRTRIVEAGLIIFGALVAGIGAAITIAFAPFILTALAIAAVIAAVVLVVEDLFVLFTGGKSLIGDLIDEFFGIGAAEAVVRTVTRAAKGLFDIFRGLSGEQGLGVLGGIGFAIREVALFIVDSFAMAFQTVFALWRTLGQIVVAVATAVKDAWQAAVDFVVELIEDTVALVRRLTSSITNALNRVRRLAGRFTGPVDSPVLKRARAALEAAQAAQAGSQTTVVGPAPAGTGATTVNQNNTTNIQVTAPNAEAAAAAVDARIRESQQRQIRQASESIRRTL